MKNLQDYRNIERVVKGFANYRRLEILVLLKNKPDLSVDDISGHIKSGYENTSDHLRKMNLAGLLFKRNDGPSVRHRLTLRAETILAFCKKLQ